MTKKTIKIYSIHNPIDNKVVYVGKAISPKERFAQHLCDSKGTSKRKLHVWLREMSKLNLTPNIGVLEDNCDEKNWQEREIFWINFYSLDNKLLNTKKGGGGNTGNLSNHKVLRSLSLGSALIKKIEDKAKKEKRSAHWLMVEALEKSFKK